MTLIHSNNQMPEAPLGSSQSAHKPSTNRGFAAGSSAQEDPAQANEASPGKTEEALLFSELLTQNANQMLAAMGQTTLNPSSENFASKAQKKKDESDTQQSQNRSDRLKPPSRGSLSQASNATEANTRTKDALTSPSALSQIMRQMDLVQSNQARAILPQPSSALFNAAQTFRAKPAHLDVNPSQTHPPMQSTQGVDSGSANSSRTPGGLASGEQFGLNSTPTGRTESNTGAPTGAGFSPNGSTAQPSGHPASNGLNGSTQPRLADGSATQAGSGSSAFTGPSSHSNPDATLSAGAASQHSATARNANSLESRGSERPLTQSSLQSTTQSATQSGTRSAAQLAAQSNRHINQAAHPESRATERVGRSTGKETKRPSTQALADRTLQRASAQSTAANAQTLRSLAEASANKPVAISASGSAATAEPDLKSDQTLAGPMHRAASAAHSKSPLSSPGASQAARVQWVQTLARQVSHMALQSLSSAQFEVNLEQIGPMRLTIQSVRQSGQAAFDVSVQANEEATRLIQANSSGLKESLLAQGVSLNQLTVQTVSQTEQASANGNGQNTSSSNQNNGQSSGFLSSDGNPNNSRNRSESQATVTGQPVQADAAEPTEPALGLPTSRLNIIA